MIEDVSTIEVGEEIFYVRIIDTHNINDILLLKVRTVYETGSIIGLNPANGEALLISAETLKERAFRSHIEAKKFSDAHINKLQRQLTKETEKDGEN